MLFGDQPHQFLLLSFGQSRGDADVLFLILLGFDILVFGFFINNQKAGNFTAEPEARKRYSCSVVFPVTSTCSVS